MKLKTEHTPVTSTLTGESRKFSIATNAKAFRTLVDGLYADKIGSITRELMSNAFDAHQRRGNPKEAFELYLPNGMNTTFAVRDFGCGMSHDEVMDRYSTLFDSSKTESNNEVGAFGLGAKSFLAYTDAATLDCWDGTEVRTYSIALDSEGIPTVTLVVRAPSTEPQGVKIGFAVNQPDFGAFTAAAAHCLLGFVVPPKVIGGTTSIKVPKPVFGGPGWRAFKDLRTNYVRQGCAVYPFDLGYYDGVQGYQLIVDVPIGEASVTASRESLALTTGERGKIGGRFRGAKLAFGKQVEMVYEGLTTEYERAKYAHENGHLMNNRPSTRINLGFSVPTLGFELDESQIEYATIERSVFLLDDGSKMLRRVKRLDAFRRASVARGQNRRVFILPVDGHSVTVEDPYTGTKKVWQFTQAQVQTLKDKLQLNPSQVMKISDIPDVHVPSRKGGGGAPRKVINTSRVWAYAEGNVASAGKYSWSRREGNTLGIAPVYLNAAVKLPADGVLYVTAREAEKALKAGTLKEANRLDLVVDRAMAQHDGKVEAHHRYQLFKNHLRDMNIRNLVAGKFGVTSADEMPDQIMRVYGVIRKDQNVRAQQLAQNWFRSTVVQRYPLLFGMDVNVVNEYLAMADRAAKKPAKV